VIHWESIFQHLLKLCLLGHGTCLLNAFARLENEQKEQKEKKKENDEEEEEEQDTEDEDEEKPSERRRERILFLQVILEIWF